MIAKATEADVLIERLLITGGAGSLGSNLVQNLIRRCAKVMVIDNFVTGKRLALSPHPQLMVRAGSVTDEKFLFQTFDEFRPTHVVHAAASYKNPNDWVNDSLVNVIGTINVVKASEKVNVKRFVNFQTALCYGRPSVVPIPINHPCAPFTSYGISKTAGESIVAASSLPWISLRLANVTGPRLAIGPIPTFYKKLKNGQPCTVSTTVRDFLDMEDFFSLMDLVLNGMEIGCFNVSTGEGHSIVEVFNLVARHVGVPGAQPAAVVMPGVDDIAEVVLDPSHTERTFGWRARVSFEQTITRMLSWYDRYGITDIYSHLQERQ